MAEPYLGEIRIVGFNFAPVGWAFCDGSLLSIAANSALFQLIGTTYGGNGTTNFALPDLRGRLPIHQGSHAGISHTLGESGGAEAVTLTVAQLPAHSHPAGAQVASGTQPGPGNGVWAQLSSTDLYSTNAPNASINAALASSGGGGAHNNLMPFLVITFIIALQGIFPSQS